MRREEADHEMREQTGFFWKPGTDQSKAAIQESSRVTGRGQVPGKSVLHRWTRRDDEGMGGTGSARQQGRAEWGRQAGHIRQDEEGGQDTDKTLGMAHSEMATIPQWEISIVDPKKWGDRLQVVGPARVGVTKVVTIKGVLQTTSVKKEVYFMPFVRNYVIILLLCTYNVQ